MVILNSTVAGSPTTSAGIEVERGTSNNVVLRWNESSDKWEISNDAGSYFEISTATDLSSHESDTINVHGISNTAELVTLAGSQTLTNKTLTSPTITGVSPVITLSGDLTGNVTLSNLSSGTLSAQIASDTIVNADVSTSAAIALSKLASGTSGQVVVANATGVPTYVTLSGDVTLAANGAVTIAANSVALGADTTGDYVSNVTAGTGVTITNAGGEGANPTFAIGQSVATNAEVTFSGIKTTSVIEPLSISATAATGTVAIDAANGTTYYTSNASANWVVNLRWNSSTTLDSKLATGEMTTTSFMARQGGTAYYPTSIQVNGTTSGVTTRWQGSTGAPTSGNANSTDMYTFTVVKTGNATFDVFAAQTRFA